MPTIPSVIKQPGESRLYSMEFAALLAAGETLSAISSVTITPTTLSPLTSSDHSVSGTKARFRLSGGIAGQKYKTTVVVTTTDANTLEGEGIVQSEDL